MNTLPTTPAAVKVAVARQLNAQHPTWPASTIAGHADRCCTGAEILATRRLSSSC